MIFYFHGACRVIKRGFGSYMCRQKIKIFMALIEGFFHVRGMSVDLACHVCSAIEDELHVFIGCQFAKDCWNCLGVGYS